MEQSPFQRFPGGPQQQANPGYSDSNVRDASSGSFSRPPLQAHDSPAAFRSAPAVPGGFWPGPGVFQQPPPSSQTSASNNNNNSSQRFSYAQAEWPPVPPPGGHDSGGFRPPFPQMQSFSMGSQNPPVPADFDPTRPPPPLYEAQPGPFRHTFEDREGPVPRPPPDYTHWDGPPTPWQSGSDARSEAPHFNRSFEEHRSYPSSGPPPSLPGLQNLGNADYQRQRSMAGVSGDRVQRGSTDHQTQGEPWQQRDQHRGQDSGHSHKPPPSLSDAEARQRQADERWLVRFLLKRKTSKSCASKRPSDNPSVSEAREALYGAARLVSELSSACQHLRENAENERVWAEAYPRAMALKRDVMEKLKLFSDRAYLDGVKRKLSLVSKKRVRSRRKKREWVEEQEEEDARAAQREAVIDKWRMKRIQQVEERKRELELKKAADSVLSEVRKKQADARRMLDILRSLEKLRKLRKEAAGRKGVVPEKEADEEFEGHVERLRKLIGKRTGVYAAEEKALRVMLEGEQEEERRRELELRQRKEREKFLQKRREAEAMLFGAEMHPDDPLQPFRQCYTQADHSLHALIQIRGQWDRFLVQGDHPEGSSIPQSWVLPELPCDETWASALEKYYT